MAALHEETIHEDACNKRKAKDKKKKKWLHTKILPIRNGVLSLFNGILTCMGYLVSKPSCRTVVLIFNQ